MPTKNDTQLYLPNSIYTKAAAAWLNGRAAAAEGTTKESETAQPAAHRRGAGWVSTLAEQCTPKIYDQGSSIYDGLQPSSISSLIVGVAGCWLSATALARTSSGALG